MAFSSNLSVCRACGGLIPGDVQPFTRCEHCGAVLMPSDFGGLRNQHSNVSSAELSNFGGVDKQVGFQSPFLLDNNRIAKQQRITKTKLDVKPKYDIQEVRVRKAAESRPVKRKPMNGVAAVLFVMLTLSVIGWLGVNTIGTVLSGYGEAIGAMQDALNADTPAITEQSGTNNYTLRGLGEASDVLKTAEQCDCCCCGGRTHCDMYVEVYGACPCNKCMVAKFVGSDRRFCANCEYDKYGRCKHCDGGDDFEEFPVNDKFIQEVRDIYGIIIEDDYNILGRPAPTGGRTVQQEFEFVFDVLEGRIIRDVVAFYRDIMAFPEFVIKILPGEGEYTGIPASAYSTGLFKLASMENKVYIELYFYEGGAHGSVRNVNAYTIAHEFGHALHYAMEFENVLARQYEGLGWVGETSPFEDAFNLFNGDYVYTGYSADFYAIWDGNYDRLTQVFSSAYGMTSYEEDIAELFALLITEPLEMQRRMRSSNIITSKVKYLQWMVSEYLYDGEQHHIFPDVAVAVQ